MSSAALTLNPQIEKLHAVFDVQKAAFKLDMMPSYEQRIDLLNQLESLLLDNQTAIAEAINQDFGCLLPH